MKGIRIERLQEEILREIASILEMEVRDPRLSMVTVTVSYPGQSALGDSGLIAIFTSGGML